MVKPGSGAIAAIVAALAAFVLVGAASAATARTYDGPPDGGAAASSQLGMGPAHWFGRGGWGTFDAVPPTAAATGPNERTSERTLFGRSTKRSTKAVDNLSNPGNGEIMPTTATYVIFWLPSGNHFSNGTTAASDTNYENTILQYFRDVGGSQILNTTTQYSGNNGTPADTSTLVTSVVDTTAYPHAGTTARPDHRERPQHRGLQQHHLERLAEGHVDDVLHLPPERRRRLRRQHSSELQHEQVLRLPHLRVQR